MSKNRPEKPVMVGAAEEGWGDENSELILVIAGISIGSTSIASDDIDETGSCVTY